MPSTWEVKVFSRANPAALISLVPRWTEVSWGKALSDVVGCQVSIPRNDPIFRGSVLAPATDLYPGTQIYPAGDQILEEESIWRIYENGVLRGSFFCEEIDKTHVDESGQAVVKVSGRTLGKGLEHPTVLPPGYPAYAEKDHAWTATSAMKAWRQLFDEAVARSAVPAPLTTTIGQTTDSAGVPWSDSQDFRRAPGGDLLETLKRYAEVAGAEWAVTAEGVVEAKLSYGVHRENQVVFHVGGSLLKLAEHLTRREVKSHVYLEAGDGSVGASSDSESVARWGKRETWVTAGDADDQATANTYAAQVLATLKHQLNHITAKVAPDLPGRKILTDYDVGDWVKLEFDDSPPGTAARQVVVRVAAANFTVDSTGRLDLEVTFGDPQKQALVRMREAVDRLGEGPSLIPDLGDFGSLGGMGGGGTPSDTVEHEVTFGQLPDPGDDDETLSRGDHTHGTPPDPVPYHEEDDDPHPAYVTGITAVQPLAATAGKVPTVTMRIATFAQSGSMSAAQAAAVDQRTPLPTPVTIMARDASGQVEVAVGTIAAHPVRRDDERLADARVPITHAATHLAGGTDVIAQATSGARGLMPATDKEKLDAATSSPTANALAIRDASGTTQFAVGTLAGHPVRRDDARLTDARTPVTHATSHLAGGTDVIAVATQSSRGLMSSADKTNLDNLVGGGAAGVASYEGRTGTVVAIAADVQNALGYTPVNTTDSRLSDARAPTAHASTHYGVGADAIPVATTSVGGLMSYQDKTKLDGISEGGVAGVASYNGRTGTVVGIAADVTNALSYFPVNKAGDAMTGTHIYGALSGAYPRVVLDSGTAGIRFERSSTERISMTQDVATASGIGQGVTFRDEHTGQTIAAACTGSAFWDVGPNLRTAGSGKYVGIGVGGTGLAADPHQINFQYADGNVAQITTLEGGAGNETRQLSLTSGSSDWTRPAAMIDLKASANGISAEVRVWGKLVASNGHFFSLLTVQGGLVVSGGSGLNVTGAGYISGALTVGTNLSALTVYSPATITAGDTLAAGNIVTSNVFRGNQYQGVGGNQPGWLRGWNGNGHSFGWDGANGDLHFYVDGGYVGGISFW